jgi:hypothetical protein
MFDKYLINDYYSGLLVQFFLILYYFLPEAVFRQNWTISTSVTLWRQGGPPQHGPTKDQNCGLDHSGWSLWNPAHRSGDFHSRDILGESLEVKAHWELGTLSDFQVF